MVDGAMGHEENDKPRMVKSPWFDHEVPFDLAAETGTRKVICEHSTIGIVVTTDGSVSDIPREGYAKTERRIVEELDLLGKPYIILLNSTHPDAPETKQLAEGMARDRCCMSFRCRSWILPCRDGSRCWKTATGCRHRCMMQPCSWQKPFPA